MKLRKISRKLQEIIWRLALFLFCLQEITQKQAIEK